ncbi:heme biosynthesis HemY N-terminal domain-containing protein [Paraglaciecola sp. 2405UD69-4]|uniref:heme biosynthesis HemY N-terminal domain-containing protein n=1 Tax=Paraglaciecola sp. 2405UD69-4 TaxID=3391836 RepID=UPI0039C95216
MNQLIRIFVVFFVLLIALVIAAMFFDDRGYVLVEFSGSIIEMNVMSLCLSLIFIFIGFMLINFIIKLLLAAASGSRSWFGSWGHRKNQKAFTQGLLALAETNYIAAREHLQKIENVDFDGLNLLAAADVELQLGQPEKAKALWKKATSYDKASLAANLCLIRDALNTQDHATALKLIEELDPQQQSQTPVIKLWAQALYQSRKWQILKDKLKGWKKALGADYEVFMQHASTGSFAEIASKEGAAQLKQNWQALPRATRKDPAQQASYIQQLIDQGLHSDAESALVEYQKSGPHALLLPLFKQIKLPNPSLAIKKLEAWLKQDAENVELLSVLGHIAHNAGDDLLAEKALAKAIKLGSQQADLMLMASIKEKQHDDSQALQLYKQSMQQAK